MKAEMMNTKQQTAAIVYAVRTGFDHACGGYNHEYLYGQEPTVFRNRADAEKRCKDLNDEAATLDWGSSYLPSYAVEEVREDRLFDSEEIAQ